MAAKKTNKMAVELDEELVKADISDDTMEQLSEMDKLRQEAEEARNFALRTRADLENMKKRNQNIASEMYASGKTDVIKKILPIADSFERAAALITESTTASDGFMMIKKQLDDMLEKLGVTEIDSLGCELNTDLHNAIMQVDDEANCGKITQVYEKGYMLDGKVIRHATVIVAK